MKSNVVAIKASRSATVARPKLKSLSRADEMSANINALNRVVTEVLKAANTEDAIRIALEVVREAFSWAYGSFWSLNHEERALKFKLDAGTVNNEFKRVTEAAAFKEGVGLS